MSTYTDLDFDQIKRAVHNGGVAGLADYATDDVELREIDHNPPPAAPAVYSGREALTAFAEELERRGVRMQIDDGFIAGDRGALRVMCSHPDGRQVVEHTLLTLRDGEIARWSGVQVWDE